MSLKILVSGDAEGNISALFKRVEAVNAKAGPFEMLLCVGSFFGPGNLGWSDYKSGRCKVPLPTYILGPTAPAQLSAYPEMAGCELAENVIYLGRQGCFTTKEGLRIAYISGSQAQDSLEAGAHNYTVESLNSLEATLRWDSDKYQGVDILMSSDWPKGISNLLNKRPDTVDDETHGSALISRLALLSRPRYHFAGLHGEHFERPPYRNHAIGSEVSKHVTRFISLARVGNKEKKKWLYAFNVTPLTTMDHHELVAQPQGVTDMPFREQHITIDTGNSGGNGAFRWDMNAKMDEHERGKKRKRDGDQGGGPPAKPAASCWFCLSSPEVEKHLIVSVGNHMYLALPKGGLTEDHVLILPIACIANQISLPEEALEELKKFKSALRKMYKKHGKSAVFFERNYKQTHCQIQVVPVQRETASRVKPAWLETASSLELDLNEIPDHVPLAQLAVQGQAYLHVETPERETLFGRILRNFPLQFGREVMADERLLDMAERVDWKACSVSRDEEVDMTKALRKMFTPFDFTME